MAELPKGRKQKKWDFLGGGLVTRPDDRMISLLNDKGHLYSPAETNLQFTKIASMQKRLGYTAVGGFIQNAQWYIAGGGFTASTPLATVDNKTYAMCFKITAPSSASVISMYAFIYTAVGAGNNLDRVLLKNIKCVIKSNSAGSPGATLGTSNAYNDALEIPQNSSYAPATFYFPSPVALTNGTDYWFCFEGQYQSGASATSLSFLSAVNTGAGTAKVTNDSYATFTTQTATITMGIYSTIAPIQGIYDYRPQASGVITQFPMTACNGTLYYYNAGYTSIKAGLSSSANSLFDFSTLKNYLFSCDYGVTANQCWDGAAAATMTHGYRQSTTGGNNIALAQSGSAGGPWSANGIVKVMLVTALRSGGYRCSQPVSITIAAGTNKIDITGIAVDAIAAQFSFDVAATATTIYCTTPNGAIYYKVPAASLSTAGNPIANTQTANSILPMTDATLIAGGSFETNLQYPQGYATGQVDTPKAKFFEVFQNMLVSGGDPSNPSRVWFSEQNAPQVWGNGDSGTSIQGDYLDIATDDGETITGMAIADGALIIGKQNRLYRVDYTGNAIEAFAVNPVHSPVGVLSNWSMQVIPDGLFFLSNRGPAICYGTYADVLPQTRMIQNLFDNTAAESFNLSSMIYAVACNDTTRNQVLVTVSSPGVTIRDRILSYDYEQKMFQLYDGYRANYIAIIGDSNGFPVLYNGNLSGQLFKRSSDYYDSDAYIITSWLSPELNLSEPNTFNQVEWLYLAGKVQTSGNLYLDFYAGGTSPYRTIQFDMTRADFADGLAVRVGTLGRISKFRIRSVDFTGVSGFELHWMRLEWSDAGGTRMG